MPAWIPIIMAATAAAKGIGGVVEAQGIYGEADKERLKELEEAGLTTESEEGLRALAGEMLDPLEISASEEEEERRRRFTPFTAEGLFGAVARGTQGSEERMARALEIPQMKLIEERRRREIAEEEEIAHLEDLRSEKRRAIATSLLQASAEAGQAAMAYESFKGEQKFEREQVERFAKRFGSVEPNAKYDADDYRDAYNYFHGDGSFEKQYKYYFDFTETQEPGTEPISAASPMGDFPLTGSSSTYG